MEDKHVPFSFSNYYENLLSSGKSNLEIEKEISNNFAYSIEYAKKIIMKRFPRVEMRRIVRTNQCFACFYLKDVIKKRHSYYEKVIARGDDHFYIREYMRSLKEEDKKDFLKKYDLHEYLV